MWLKGIWSSLWLLLLRYESIREAFSLYCKAQCSIAITRAHQISLEHNTTEENRRLEADARRIVKEVDRDLSMSRDLLGGATPEIEWRSRNALVVLALRSRTDVRQAQDIARKTVFQAPFALAVKANLGSLCLLSTAMSSEGRAKRSSHPDFREAVTIFEELHETGWDPGFVRYRLATIRRVQGKFSAARLLLKEASGPAQRDVPEQKIRNQLAKVERRDKSLSIEDFN
jgi:hypothetical protein